MHELSLAMELYRSCRAEIDARGGGRLEAARVRIGELSAVEPELLQFAWGAVVAAGPDDSATLVVEECKAFQVCGRCDAACVRADDRWLSACPQCGEPLRVEGGRELELTSVTYDEHAHRTEAAS